MAEVANHFPLGKQLVSRLVKQAPSLLLVRCNSSWTDDGRGYDISAEITFPHLRKIRDPTNDDRMTATLTLPSARTLSHEVGY